MNLRFTIYDLRAPLAFVALVLFVALAVAAESLTTTNAPAPPPNLPQIPDTLEPLVNILPTWVSQVIVWVVALNLALAPFSVWISHRLRDMLNRAAASAEEDDDLFLRNLFSKPWYRAIALGLRFINVDLPTVSDLERAVSLQAEAVHEAKVQRGTAPQNY